MALSLKSVRFEVHVGEAASAAFAPVVLYTRLCLMCNVLSDTYQRNGDL